MKAYILSIAGVILIASVITVISPDGKMGQFVKGTARLFLLVVMLSPIFGAFNGTGELAPSASYESDAGYFAACAGLLSARDGEQIAAYLEEEYGVSADVTVKRKDSANFDREKISIRVTFQGIIGGDERIHILTRIREDVGERYGCETEVT